MSNYFIESLFERNRSMQSREQMLNLHYLLLQVLGVEGDVVELGTYRGLTAILLQKTLKAYGSKKALHLYDSFEGLPEKSREDCVLSDTKMRRCDYLDNQRLGKGWFASSLEALKEQFAAFDEPLPYIHPGFFEATLPGELPEKIAFAHLDADFYSSTKSALEALLPRMTKGSLLIVDDYCHPALHPRQNQFPGVKRACDEIFGKDLELLAGGTEYHAVFRF